MEDGNFKSTKSRHIRINVERVVISKESVEESTVFVGLLFNLYSRGCFRECRDR
jgi:hypothetical protein